MNKRINPTHSEGIDGDEWDRLLADVRGHMWEFLRKKGNTFEKLARAAGVCTGTVSKFSYGDTSSPHMRTVMRIMTALGKSDLILTAFKAEEPVSLKQASDWRLTRAKKRQKLITKIKPHQIKGLMRASVRRGRETRH